MTKENIKNIVDKVAIEHNREICNIEITERDCDYEVKVSFINERGFVIRNVTKN